MTAARVGISGHIGTDIGAPSVMDAGAVAVALGSASVTCSDKTGTQTCSEMTTGLVAALVRMVSAKQGQPHGERLASLGCCAEPERMGDVRSARLMLDGLPVLVTCVSA